MSQFDASSITVVASSNPPLAIHNEAPHSVVSPVAVMSEHR